MRLVVVILVILCCSGGSFGGILYPRASESRELLSLDGLWKFGIVDKNDQQRGFLERWFSSSLPECTHSIDMPVPSSYNDITQDVKIRDHIGWAWYQRSFFVPKTWKAQRVSLRFGSVNYHAIVWVNGVEVVQHSGGYLPFEAVVSKHLKYGHSNTVTVAVNNTLTPWTIPQGKIVYHNDSMRYPPGYYEQQYNFDFFNYAGIHRPVIIYATPRVHVDDISVSTSEITDGAATVSYSVRLGGVKTQDYSVYIEIYDAHSRLVAQSKDLDGMIQIADPNLWWARGMSETPGYLYTLKVQLWNDVKNEEGDVYRLPFGIRTLSWNSSGIFLNNRPVYFNGFGRHEDASLRGRGLDYVTLTKDFNLMRWIGANSFRTSHYPYSEELMDLADQQGFLVIDEVPAVGLDNFDDDLLEAHLQTLRELIQRDKNRASVVMWSIGNEPQSQKQAAASYVHSVTEFVRGLDSSRPVTLVLNKPYNQDVTAQYLDVICFNRYFSWYSDTGHLELIEYQMMNEVSAWHDKHNKSVIVTEYGAGSLAGLHTDPPVVWTEDYQVALLEEHFKAFDQLREKGYLIGEMIWNFADFATPQGVNRVVVNRKGVFTRERQPKSAAHQLKKRYLSLLRFP